MKTKLLSSILALLIGLTAKAQCHYIPTTDAPADTLSWTFYGGSSQSYGCLPIDPTYWISGYGDSVLVTFAHPQSYPTFRVWGMNTDDSATVFVNGTAYPLDSSSASYDAKDTCGQSPGPDGIGFSAGNLVGVLTDVQGNYSYQNVQIKATNVSSITVKGLAGLGWGFAGVTIDCQSSGISQLTNTVSTLVYPNPFSTSTTIKFISPQKNIELNIYNVCGQLVRTMQNISGDNIEIDRGNLPSGVYFIQLTQNDQNISTGKLIITDL